MTERETATAPTSLGNPTEVVVGSQRLRHLRDGLEAYPAMLDAISGAEREIVMEMYWFGSDATGRRFVQALCARAREGVTVRLVYDAVGSAPVDPALFQPLRDAGGDVRPYHPLLARLSRRAFMRSMVRDHRKLLVCDGEVGFTGGLNVGDPWAPTVDGGEGWRDDMVEVRGAAANELRTLFYETWRRVLTRKERRDPGKLPPHERGLHSVPRGDVWVMSNGRRTRRAIRNTYLRWIREATHAIDVVNAYFVPDWWLRRALLSAVRRGVRVRVLVPEHGDVTVVQWAVEATLERLTRLGVQAFAYRGRVLHAKTAVVDDAFVTVGSYNLDHRSWRWNLEVNLAVHGEPFARKVRQAVERDIGLSVPWTHQVLRARGWFRRMLGELALLFARFL